jgi:type II secretion system protein C
MNVHEGTAQLGTVRESPQTYLAGALLENGARLAEVHADYVLLRKGARSVRLYLDNSPASREPIGNALTMVGPIQEPSPPAQPASREILTDYVRPSPVYDGEVLLGYQVYAGTKSAPFAQMGLRAGDVIVAIDSTPLTDPGTSWDMFRQLIDGGFHTASRSAGAEHRRKIHR